MDEGEKGKCVLTRLVEKFFANNMTKKRRPLNTEVKGPFLF